MTDDATRVEAEAARETIVNEWLKTNSVAELTFAQFFHELRPLMSHTIPENADKNELNRILTPLYYRFVELKGA